MELLPSEVEMWQTLSILTSECELAPVPSVQPCGYHRALLSLPLAGTLL